MYTRTYRSPLVERCATFSLAYFACVDPVCSVVTVPLEPDADFHRT